MTADGPSRGHEPVARNRGMAAVLGPAVVVLAAACATAPILLHGPFCGDDFEFHVVSWFDVQQSWLHGILIPHWMQSVNYGAGEPRFMFYPPLTWMLGGALGFLLPWALVPVAMIFLSLAGIGVATRALALEVLSDAAATLAGCIAIFSGYALFSAYERTAFAELAGGFWIPLLLLFILRDRNASATVWRRALDGSTLPLAVVLAGCWISDGPVGVMGSYLLGAVAIAASVLGRSWAPLLRGSIASVLGLALTGAYLVPAAWEQPWADLRAAVDYPVFRIENNWLFARHSGASWGPFDTVLHRASLLAAWMIGVTVLAELCFFLRRRRATEGGWMAFGERGLGPDARRWILLGAIPFAVFLMLLPISLPVWNLLPKLRFLQYPWRWLLLVEAPMGIFVAAVVWPLRRTWARVVVAGVCVGVFLASTSYCARTFLRSCLEGDTVGELRSLYQSEGGLEGTDEYEPPDSDHWKIATGLPDACLTTDSDATLGVAADANSMPVWGPEQGSCLATAQAGMRNAAHLSLSMVAPQSGFLVLRLLAYPAWQITVNGHVTEPADARDDGLLAVPVAKGQVKLDADWITTPDVTAGRALTGLAVALLVGLGFVELRFGKARRA